MCQPKEWKALAEEAITHFRKEIKDRLKDSPPPDMNAKFIGGLTISQFMKLSDDVQEKYWNEAYRQEIEQLDREKEIDAPKYFTTPRQKRG